MSVFDVIKYPLSDLPTVKELDNLSPELREKLNEIIDNFFRKRFPYTTLRGSDFDSLALKRMFRTFSYTEAIVEEMRFYIGNI